MLKRSLLFTLAICITSFQSFARDTYYPERYKRVIFNSMNPDHKIKQALFELLTRAHLVQGASEDSLISECPEGDLLSCKQHIDLGYKTARQKLFGEFYLYSDNDGYAIDETYCGYTVSSKSDRVGPGTYPRNNVNTEHTWPKANFSEVFEYDTQKSDMHHLFLTDIEANRVRGNSPFGDVNGIGVTESCQTSLLGSPLDFDSSHLRIHFEPPQEHKGIVARTMFYFSIRYDLPIDPIQEFYFRKWHEEEPVSFEEINKNDFIENSQGNRNPFVDYPELVDLISDF